MDKFVLEGTVIGAKLAFEGFRDMSIGLIDT